MPSNLSLLRPDRPSSAQDARHILGPPRRPRRRRWIVLIAVVVAVGVAVPTLIAYTLLRPGGNGRTRVDAAQPTPITYWPSADNTGVPRGITLRASGALTLGTAGQTISNLDINGCVTIRASNVRILRSRIRCNGTTYGIFVATNARNVVIEDVEINGNGRVSVAICCANFTVRRANIHNVIDGIRMGDASTVVDSYIHDLARPPGSHSDALQTTGGVNLLIQHNSLVPYNAATRDPANACLMVGSELAPALRDLVMDNNYCSGGNWSIGIRTDLVASNVVFRNNKFERTFRYGVVARPRHPGVTWAANNAYFDNGTPVVR